MDTTVARIARNRLGFTPRGIAAILFGLVILFLPDAALVPIAGMIGLWAVAFAVAFLSAALHMRASVP